MDLLINHNPPEIIHIDLNSCFATIRQQAYPHLRGKPIAIAAYTTPNGCILAPSIEAKRYGIKTAMTVREGKLLCPNLLVFAPDPRMVKDVHVKFKNICRDYSPEVTPKSIDEIVIDMRCMKRLKLDLISVGKEIKERIRKEVGDWLKCNVGIGTNRFTAKLAASLHKPDGLDVIDHTNLLNIYQSVSLIDLNGINKRFEARLNAAGIYSPIQFYQATEYTLKKLVFQSIIGHYWYLRLRGYEIDDVDFERRSYGQDYALPKHTDNTDELFPIIMKLCEKMGRRLRRHGHAALGIHLGLAYKDDTYWHRGRQVNQPMYATHDLYVKALWIFNQQPEKKVVTNISVSCYDLIIDDRSQPALFDSLENKWRNVSDALDEINDRYGEYVITPAIMMGTENQVIERINFGSVVKELDELYSAS